MAPREAESDEVAEGPRVVVERGLREAMTQPDGRKALASPHDGDDAGLDPVAWAQQAADRARQREQPSSEHADTDTESRQR